MSLAPGKGMRLSLLLIIIGLVSGLNAQYPEDFYDYSPDWIRIPDPEPNDYDRSVTKLKDLLSGYVGALPQEPIYSPAKRSDSDVLASYGHPFMKHFGWQAAIIAVAVCVVAVFGVAIFATAVVRHRRSSGKRMSPQSMIGKLTGSTRSTSPHDSIIGFDAGDKKLAHSAQMYHYQHQKQQMLAMEKAANQIEGRFSDDEIVDDDSERDPEDEVDFTVFECPGLAQTGDLEVKNPLFQGDGNQTTPSDELSPCSQTGSTDLSPNFSLLDGERDEATPTESASQAM